ncbi:MULTISPECIES: asparagine synthase-related protein [Streptomycetaceae]|uniref:Asparagine synthase n=1 Tax=Streptantibioticus cattleyicolor (strain ATCC 35852 / DSM 46488 / JCM 4925 / NBRC 14057 / NRRL 8057) TaxID=1003195 RepID=F8JWH8_STREN|nr:MULTISPECIES: asparagine synthase-related protein [Streptomycetaceae]AEW95758.1 asparagine synthase [Streptantibioticus cattleyicolor NRRL 8057 = DSM 46488]MYS60303.1 asparagine synthase [Streptomyces sp. SID5468]CCB76098.1 putative secreted protein [Streptantibioticus cattleyicolor NRRL 8057 = DSM 46488]
MRWLVGWGGAPGRPSDATPFAAPRDVVPIGALPLWAGPDPLWAVGDWRSDEIRVVARGDRHAAAGGGGRYGDRVARLAVFGRCAASDDQLRAALGAARGGALRHLTAWPGSYTVVLQTGRRITVLGDLAGARPVFHTPWAGGTAYATAALPLADLAGSTLDTGHLAARLACPDAPEALRDGTPYTGVRRLPPGHALTLRAGGAPQITGYEPAASLALGAPHDGTDPDAAVAGVREALVGAVRARLTAPRHPPGPDDPPAPGVGADLSGGSASGTVALLAAGLPGPLGAPPGDGHRLLAVTFNDLAGTAGWGPDVRAAELDRARRMAADPRLRHVVVAGGAEALPYAGLAAGPLTDEPGPALITAARHRARLAAGGADHLTGHGARHVLDGHPARLADLLLDRHRRHLLRPVTALARAEGAPARAAFVPLTVYRAARRLARTSRQQGVEDAAARLLQRRFDDDPAGSGVAASVAALTWCRPGPAARWLTGDALAEVSIRLQDAAARPGASGRPGERRARAALARAAADHRIYEQAVEVRGQRLHAPFLDNEVVRAALALPETLRVRPGARTSVLRAVLAGSGVRDLPPGWGAPSYPAGGPALRTGLRVALDEVLDLFQAPLLAEAGLVDASVVRHALRAAAHGAPIALEGLADVVATEVWLRRLAARRGSCWQGPASPKARLGRATFPSTAEPAMTPWPVRPS